MGVPRPNPRQHLVPGFVHRPNLPIRRAAYEPARRVAMSRVFELTEGCDRSQARLSRRYAPSAIRPGLRFGLIAAVQILRAFNGYANLSCRGAIAPLYCDLQLLAKLESAVRCGGKCWCFRPRRVGRSAAIGQQSQQQRFDVRDGRRIIPALADRDAEDLGSIHRRARRRLKAGLRLTPEQDKNWPAFEQAYRNLAKLRARSVARQSRPGARNG